MESIHSASWMNQQRLNRARRFFESAIYCARSKDEREAAEEGLACIKAAKTNYLMNILPDSHPYRIAARKMLLDYFRGSY